MNQRIKLLILLSGIFAFVACSKDSFNYKPEFEKSYNTWLKFKEMSGNNYSYDVVFGSWTGYSSTTSITVVNGKIVQRSFKDEYKVHDGTEFKDKEGFEREEWTENESEIGSHERGAVLLTLDEIYDKALNEWLIKRGNASVYFETKNNGLISLCGYTIDGCQDDCFTGINISYIGSPNK